MYCTYWFHFQGAENEDKNDASENGDDSSVYIQQDEEIKNDFDWAAIDNVIDVCAGGKKKDSENERSIDTESKWKYESKVYPPYRIIR